MDDFILPTRRTRSTVTRHDVEVKPVAPVFFVESCLKCDLCGSPCQIMNTKSGDRRCMKCADAVMTRQAKVNLTILF